MSFEGDQERERNFKARPEHWATIVSFFEEKPNLAKNKFGHADGDNSNSKELWQTLVTLLNSTGYGERSVQKWQAAISRCKSKVKNKASLIRRERIKTGGGPSKAGQLSDIEQRLLNIMGWKSVTGDGIKELGVPNSPALTDRLKTDEEKNQSLAGPSLLNNSICPPPLLLLSNNDDNIAEQSFVPGPSSVDDSLPSPSTSTKTPKRKAPSKLEAPFTKRRTRTTTNNSRKFVTLSHMHQEQMGVLKQIDNNMKVLNETLTTLSNNFATYLNFLMNQHHQEDTN